MELFGMEIQKRQDAYQLLALALRESRGQSDWWRSFSLLWSLKESRVKESGQGLRGTIRSIRVPMMGEGETRQMDGLWFRTYGGAGWVAAV